MKINIQEIEFKIKINFEAKQPDLLAYVSIGFIDEQSRHFNCNGFTIRKSKYNGDPYLTLPSKKNGASFYKFNFIEKSLFKEIEKEVIKQYNTETIPIIEEGTKPV